MPRETEREPVRVLPYGDRALLVELPDLAAVSGTWSPDGTKIAFLDQTGALHTVDVASGAVRQIFTATFEPGRPTWSADGRVIALLRDDGPRTRSVVVVRPATL